MRAKRGRGGRVRLLGPEGQIWDFFLKNEPSLTNVIFLSKNYPKGVLWIHKDFTKSIDPFKFIVQHQTINEKLTSSQYPVHGNPSLTRTPPLAAPPLLKKQKQDYIFFYKMAVTAKKITLFTESWHSENHVKKILTIFFH